MIPYEVDPTLHTGKPHEPMLDDGFSPPAPDAGPVPSAELPTAPPHRSADAVLSEKSDF